jgi:hypothetical protein
MKKIFTDKLAMRILEFTIFFSALPVVCFILLMGYTVKIEVK